VFHQKRSRKSDLASLLRQQRLKKKIIRNLPFIALALLILALFFAKPIMIAITGYITIGHGVTVHRTSCINALKMNPERQIDIEWNKDVKETYPVKICVSSFDRVGLLADIAANISKSGANILNAKQFQTKFKRSFPEYDPSFTPAVSQ